ncbi:MAG: tripartite tricarboxylate transporter substrate-binding protein, partial [Paracoccaceae bacterium]|nr:tripartite tricarboxylate transporter substrate-binding protein [Paracoccaceae bacterium]
ALSTPLVQTPDAPTFADLGVQYNADGYFVFVAPGDMDPKARDAITAAIVEATKSGQASGMINNAFGGAVTIQGAELDALLQSEFESASALMAAVQ